MHTTHHARVTAYHAQQRRVAAARFVVIEVATGRPVGDGQPMAYDFARYVRNVRDWFDEGKFLVKRV